ncbi:hypothetical protein Tco_0906792 [Tanacetum coccineum]|uniref:Uncharacterized protein n=1 Tax=Tanacetum coccineum TaxID=301880 RepID=A0ABQ5CJF7_9ASTR
MGNVKKSIAKRTRHKRQYDRWMNERHMQSRESKVVSSEALDANIRPVNDQVSSAEVHLTAQHNVLANEQHHTDQSEPSYDTYLLEKVDSNTTPDSTNMSHRGGEIDQDAEQDQVKSPLLKAEFLKTNDMVEKEVYNELSNRFLQLEKHCISLEISMQQKEESFQSHKPCKNQESPEFREFFEINDLKAQLQAKTTLICNLKNQIKSVKEASNEAKLKKEINVLETINIELESSVAKLLAENEKLNKENEHLKQTYKELYDSIKKTRIQMKDHNDSLIAQVNSKTVENADLKAQIQEKKDYEILFQLLFGEYFNPLPHAVSPDLVAVAASRAVDPADSPSSTTIDQDVHLLVLYQQIRKFNLKSLIKSDLGTLEKKTNTITDSPNLKEVLLAARGDGIAGIKQRRRDPSGDGVRDLVTTSRRSRLNEDLESST